MGYLVLSICFASAAPLLFKIFGKRGISVVFVVPVNYVICIALGLSLGGYSATIATISASPWLPIAFLQGVFFVTNFYLIAETAHRAGASVAALASRIAVAIPVVFAFFLYGDSLTTIKCVALACAAIALYLASGGPALSLVTPWQRALPLVVFVQYGLTWTLLKYIQDRHLADGEYHAFVTVVFIFGLLIGAAVAVVQHFRGKLPVRRDGIIGGVALGFCNYLAIYFLLRALSVPGAESSLVYPSYGVGVVILSSTIAALLMGEAMPRRRLAGIVLGIAAIILLQG